METGKQRAAALLVMAFVALMAAVRSGRIEALLQGGQKTGTEETGPESVRTGETEGAARNAPQPGESARKAEKTENEAEVELSGRLHAKAAALLDIDSGRVLYAKNGGESLPMASTTKIMTCITALEADAGEELVTASAYAAGQPKVRLGMRRGMRYRLRDLLYSLMLESHNDSAVAIAEHIGAKTLSLPPAEERTKRQSMEAVKVFCDEMTRRAKELGCTDTCFLTPNGLDAEAESENGDRLRHSTTAADLARLMRYCVSGSEQKDDFLEITRTRSYSFTDADGTSGYACSNHNAFLDLMDGALSGKTGFTSQAGYCYVGALEDGERRFAVALLACGWPNHKTWKWADSRELFTYGLERYAYREFAPRVDVGELVVQDGASEDGNPYHTASVPVEVREKRLPLRILAAETDRVDARVRIESYAKAPVRKGEALGVVSYYLTDESGGSSLLAHETLCAADSVPRRDFVYICRFLADVFLPL